MRKLGWLVLGIVVAAGGCSTEDPEEAEVLPTDGVTQQQLDAFDALKVDTQKSWKWLQHEELRTPAHLSAKRVGPATLLGPRDDIKARTIEVLKTNRALFKMRDPGLELAPAREESDRYGMQHARFQQVSHGVPVVGAELSAHYDSEGHLASIDANYISDLEDVDVNPRFAAGDALQMVKADILGRTPIDESALVPDDGKLVIYAKAASVGADGKAQAPLTRLAYEYRVRALESEHPAIWVITVDAQTGDILHRYNNFQTIDAQGVGVLGDTKKFQVSNGAGGFVMQDASLGVTLRTFSAKQKEAAPGTIVASNSATSWDTGTAGKGAAVDAHFNAGVVAKYYKTVHNRDAIDGVGGALESTVHFGVQFDNAAWIGTGMIYGDGGQVFKALSVSVDVVGHEFTHGVTEKTSNLTYENQSGALNEAISDIFGAFIEHSIKPDAVKNWTIGESVTKDGSSLRDMMKPGSVPDVPQPAHMNEFVQTQQDEGGVHINSGIINNAAWLMTVGGKNPVSGVEVKYGIGWEKSEKLWYQANTKYFMATTNFAQAAAALQQAGKDVQLTTNELAIVDCAFKATGIVKGACSSVTQPQNGNPSSSTSADTTDGARSDDATDSTTKKKKSTKKKTITTEEDGCNAAGRDGTDLGSLVPLLAAVAAVGVSRRRARRPRRE
ncbi:MAG: M4 family metallopeptidase [Labilithrix sp.]